MGRNPVPSPHLFHAGRFQSEHVGTMANEIAEHKGFQSLSNRSRAAATNLSSIFDASIKRNPPCTGFEQLIATTGLRNDFR